MKQYYSNGKLLLTGEYLVLDGTTALALPTQFGQSLKVGPSEKQGILWKSFNEKGELWFEEHFKTEGDIVSSTIDKASEVSSRLANILSEANRASLSPLRPNKGYEATTHLDFSRNWGLGSSSTLVNNIAQWFEVDAYELLKTSFGGSGYDLAAAQHNQAILYSLKKAQPSVLPVRFDPPFKDELFFVHLNRKQNSRHSIEHYRNQPREQVQEAVAKMTALTHRFLQCQTLEEFELLLEIHETLISKLINTPKIKSQLFADYPRNMKSLGGWGGDFILASGGEAEKEYFRRKGYTTILGYREMIL